MDNKKNNIKNIYPLSPMQMSMLYHSLKIGDPSRDAYFRQYVLTIKGELDFDTFKKSVDILVQRYDILRTAYIYEKVKQPVQVVFKERPVSVEFKDISDMTESEKHLYIEEFKNKNRNHGFDLSKSTLLRMDIIKWAQKDYRIISCHHHILMDGWCMGIVLGELFKIYSAVLDNTPLNLDNVHPYSNYIMWLEKQDKAEARKYWCDYLNGYEKLATVPCNKANDKKDYLLEESTFCIDKETTLRLEMLARDNGITMSTVVQILWGFILHSYTETKDVIFGTVVSGRPASLEGVGSIVGLFINTVPVRIRFADGIGFRYLAREVQESILNADKYHYLLLSDILSGTKLKQASLDHIVAYENYPATDNLETNTFTVEKIEAMEEQTSYDFNIMVMPQGELTVKFSYNACTYSPIVIETVKKHVLEAASRLSSDADGLLNDKDFQKRISSEILESVKNSELLDILDENLIFAEVPYLEQGDFQF